MHLFVCVIYTQQQSGLSIVAEVIISNTEIHL